MISTMNSYLVSDKPIIYADINVFRYLDYAKTKNIRAVQLLLGHTKVDNTICYLGVELEDSIRISEETDC